jgi:hypothetical protein
VEYQRIVKKNEWYTFSGQFHISSGRGRPRVSNPTNITLHLAYSNCWFGDHFPGYVQIDNVRVELIG